MSWRFAGSRSKVTDRRSLRPRTSTTRTIAIRRLLSKMYQTPVRRALELRHRRPQMHHPRSPPVCAHEPLIPPLGAPAEIITRCSRSVAVLRDVAHPSSSPADSTRYRGPSSVRRCSIVPATSSRALSMTQCAGEVSRAKSWGCQRGPSSRMSSVSNKCSILASWPAFQFAPANRAPTRPVRPRQCGPSAALTNALRCRR